MWGVTAEELSSPFLRMHETNGLSCCVFFFFFFCKDWVDVKTGSCELVTCMYTHP